LAVNNVDRVPLPQPLMVSVVVFNLPTPGMITPVETASPPNSSKIYKINLFASDSKNH
jgi:hypothetical protein